MSKNKSLYELIHSMNKNEKRQFKIQAVLHTGGKTNKYVQLFDLFEGIRTFDESTIQKKAAKAPFIKHFAAEKNYLYQQILDHLDNYHKESSVDREISKLLNIGRILMEKKLDDQGVKVLNKARELSLEQNRHENLIPINDLLLRNRFDKETMTQQYIDEFHREERNAIKHLNQKLFFKQAFNQLALIRRMHGKITDPTRLQAITQDFPHLTEPIPSQMHYWDSAVYYFLSLLEFCRLTHNRDLGREAALKLFQIMESDRSKITGEYIDRYSYALYAFILIHGYQTEEEKNAALDKLRHLDKYIDSKVTNREHARTFEYHHTTLTHIYLSTKEYHKVWDLLPDFERAEALYKEHITPSFNVAMHFNIASLFFGNQDYRQSLKWSNKVHNAALSFRKDIYHYLRTLVLILHWELGNIETLKSTAKAVQYYNKKNGVVSEIQNIIIQHSKEWIKANSRSEKRSLFEQLKTQFEKLSNTPGESLVFEEIDLMGWVNRKCADPV